MYSFYGGQKGQDFKISRIFSNRAIDMLGDLKMRWTSPVGVGEYVFISYGDPSYMNEEDSTYNENLQIDLKASGKSYTNSLWQKIYVDKNLEISPDFPDGDNNVYIFLNLDDIESEEYGNSLKETSDLETEENFGLGYRLIACVTGVTPRIRVFHQTINLEDGDPYVTLDLTNPDTPKIKFYLQRGQRINDLYKTMIGSQEEPSIDYIVDSDFYYKDKKGNNKQATLTNPYVNFNLPKAPTFFTGGLFGSGALSRFRNIGYINDDLTKYVSDEYTLYQSDCKLISDISWFLRRMLYADNVEYTYNEATDTIIIDNGNHFNLQLPENYKGTTYKSGIWVQDNSQIIFNILNNTQLKNEIAEFRQNLIDTYKISDNFEDGDESDQRTKWYWIRPETGEQVSLWDTMINFYPTLLNSIHELAYAIFCYLMVIESQTQPFYIDNINICSYLVSVFNLYASIDVHFNEILEKGFKGDFYINEPTGKIYEIAEIGKKYIFVLYLGALTAPAPIPENISIPSFYKAKDGTYRKNQFYVSSSVQELNNDKYQEIYRFQFPNLPISKFSTTRTDNLNNYQINNPVPLNENEQEINVKTPMPIHIFTPNDEYNMYITVNGEFGFRKGKNIFSLIDAPIGKGDLFINITSNGSSAYQGNVYQCKLSYDEIQERIKNYQGPTITLKDIWDQDNPLGNIQGQSGIPIAVQVVNLYSNLPENFTEDFGNNKVIYAGFVNGTTDNFIYYINPSVTEEGFNLEELIKNNVLDGQQRGIKTSDDIPLYNIDFKTGNVILINYYNLNGTLQSFWAVKINGIWNIISFALDSALSFNNNQIISYGEKWYSSQGYSVQYLEPRLLKIEQSLQWKRWD